ncbi:hypothetical protein IKN40_04485 [bacterium]|nr:hypothetical protein [bacterium]
MKCEFLNDKELLKYCDVMTKNKIKCKCGHSIILPPHLNKVICNWCNNYVFRSKKDEFEYRIQEAMHREVENKNKKRDN